jgi:hypothetical protein
MTATLGTVSSWKHGSVTIQWDKHDQYIVIHTDPDCGAPQTFYDVHPDKAWRRFRRIAKTILTAIKKDIEL